MKLITRDPGLGVLGGEHVAQGTQGRRLALGEEAHRWHILHPVQHHLPGDCIPVVGLLEHVVVGVAAVHLRGPAAALAGKLVGVGRGASRRGGWADDRRGAKSRRHAQRSRSTMPARMAIAPTSISDPGASRGGPMTRL